MEVKGITGRYDYMDVRIDDRVVRIPGELIYKGFVADKDGIKKWNDGEPISESEKQEIIDAVLRKANGSCMKITFE